MDRFSTVLVHALAGFPVFLVALVLLTLGPVGLFLFPFFVLTVMAILSWDGDDEPPVRRNCSDCGAPNEISSDRCTHCDSSLESVDGN